MLHVEAVISRIKEKQEFRNLDNSVVENIISIQLKRKKYNLEKKKDLKELVKNVRAVLRKKISAFEDFNESSFLLLKNKKYTELLKLHKSTSERLSIYKEIYSKIFNITGKPKIILDLACGLNPLSAVYLGFSGFEYYAYDISSEAVDLVNRFFKNEGINGQAFVADVLSAGEFPKSDICFIFKALDILEPAKGHKFAEKLITSVNAKYIIASFPKKTLSGRKMNFPRRAWLEKMCSRLNFKFEVLDFENEIFYIVKKV